MSKLRWFFSLLVCVCLTRHSEQIYIKTVCDNFVTFAEIGSSLTVELGRDTFQCREVCITISGVTCTALVHNSVPIVDAPQVNVACLSADSIATSTTLLSCTISGESPFEIIIKSGKNMYVYNTCIHHMYVYIMSVVSNPSTWLSLSPTPPTCVNDQIVTVTYVGESDSTTPTIHTCNTLAQPTMTTGSLLAYYTQLYLSYYLYIYDYTYRL